MSKIAWTPGPWYPPHLCDDTTTCNCRSIIDGGYAGGIASVHVHNGIALVSEGGNDAPPLNEAKANGRLIAAAPELYEALAALLGGDDKLQVGIGGNPIYVEAFLAKARAALAKARGE